MELESRTGSLTVTLPKSAALALLADADYGLRLIEALRLSQVPASTEAAIATLRRQVDKARGRAVDVTMTRVEASLVVKAADVAAAGRAAGDPPAAQTATPSALEPLRRAVDASDPTSLIPTSPKRRLR
jgi:hypothetical protein